MKKLIVLLSCMFATLSFSQTFYEELKNSVERAEGGSGAEVVYYIFMSSTQSNTYYAKNFDKGTLVEKDGVPQYFELEKKKGDEKEVLNINLTSVRYTELEAGYRKGGYKYIFRFYY
ncbi:hypothetical protein K6119_12325 [Paracrocinitomix mangrovi]|uniref:hypothetical protein n=1 Tax=Paracrocinitomix mangrovi TaxID=2862509 RepID=UPI001C8E0722|nr:hypothetical protein [Paracrocinitomix mangrovi]UKN00518.1 hypothetical protein K6119_12325 [Paracrocinitomix mangrovi]